MAKRETQSCDALEAAQTIAGGCIAQRTRRLDRLVMSIYAAELRDFDLKVTQLTLLVAILLNAPVQPADLAEELDIEPSTLSRNVARMESRGWVRTRVDRQDARASTVELTAKGKRIIEQVFPRWQEAQRKAKARFGTDALTAIDGLLDA